MNSKNYILIITLSLISFSPLCFGSNLIAQTSSLNTKPLAISPIAIHPTLTPITNNILSPVNASKYPTTNTGSVIPTQTPLIDTSVPVSSTTPAITSTSSNTQPAPNKDIPTPPSISVPPIKPVLTTTPPITTPPLQIRPVTVNPVVPAPTQLSPNCPPINPLDNGKALECPKVENIPIIPQFPFIVLGTPLLAVALFWIFFAFLNKNQKLSLDRINQKRLNNQSKLLALNSREQTYQHLLDFITSELGSPNTLNSQQYQKLLAKIQLVGSPEIQEACTKLSKYFDNNNRSALKKSLREIIQQIKTEL